MQWHQNYDRSNSSLARRLRVVQACLRRALDEIGPGQCGTLRLISMCAADGRDVLPVLAAHDTAGRVRALLVELDPGLADHARTTATRLGLDRVEVRTADAGITDPYIDLAPAHVVLACGVFGNIPTDHVQLLHRATDTIFRVGMHRLDRPAVETLTPGKRMFTFT